VTTWQGLRSTLTYNLLLKVLVDLGVTFEIWNNKAHILPGKLTDTSRVHDLTGFCNDLLGSNRKTPVGKSETWEELTAAMS
jgi:hypothetical protein